MTAAYLSVPSHLQQLLWYADEAWHVTMGSGTVDSYQISVMGQLRSKKHALQVSPPPTPKGGPSSGVGVRGAG